MHEALHPRIVHYTDKLSVCCCIKQEFVDFKQKLAGLNSIQNLNKVWESKKSHKTYNHIKWPLIHWINSPTLYIRSPMSVLGMSVYVI